MFTVPVFRSLGWQKHHKNWALWQGLGMVSSLWLFNCNRWIFEYSCHKFARRGPILFCIAVLCLQASLHGRSTFCILTKEGEVQEDNFYCFQTKNLWQKWNDSLRNSELKALECKDLNSRAMWNRTCGTQQCNLCSILQLPCLCPRSLQSMATPWVVD